MPSNVRDAVLTNLDALSVVVDSKLILEDKDDLVGDLIHGVLGDDFDDVKLSITDRFNVSKMSAQAAMVEIGDNWSTKSNNSLSANIHRKEFSKRLGVL